MAESTLEAPAELSQRPILATKLAIPPHRADVVLRPRLTRGLNDALAGRLTVISAPPGFGKTTLVTEWLSEFTNRDRVAWISLDDGDNDPARFLTYLISAIRTVEREFVPGLLNLLYAPIGGSQSFALTDLANGLSQMLDPLVLVLDDYHAIADEAVHQALAFILEHQPAQMHVVITTRISPPLPLTLMRTRRELTEFGVEELRFTVDEATSFLNDVMGLDLDEEVIAALDERTEGWIAGLLLAALSGAGDRGGEPDLLGGDDRYIFDYLAEEVIQRQPGDIRQFLMNTAVLQRMSGDLARTLAGEGLEMLERLVASNLFTIPLDNRRAWYRYHHLFGEFLATRLRELDPDRWREQHRAAAGWFHGQRLFAEAAEHAIAAGDHERLTGILTEVGPGAVQRGDIFTVLRWLEAMPEALIVRDPGLILLQASASMFNFNFADATSWLDRLHLDEMAGDDETLALRTEAAATRATLARFEGDGDEVVRQSLIALDLYARSDNPDQPASCVPLLHLGAIYDMTGEMRRAVEMLTAAIERAEGSDHRLVELNAMSHLADALCELGRLTDAEKVSREMMELEARLGLRRVAITEAGRVSRARILRERLRYDEARILVLDTLETVEATGERRDLAAQVQSLYERALTEIACGHPAGALEAIDDAMERTLRHTRTPGFGWRIGALVAHIQLLTGNFDKAQAWANERDLSESGPIAYFDERPASVRAWIDIDRGRISDARDLLERLIATLIETGREYRLAEARLLLAVVSHREGDRSAAEELIDLAVGYALSEDCRRMLVDAHPGIRPLIPAARERAIKRGLDWPPEIDEMLGDLGAPGKGSLASNQSALIEPLTARELEVLALLAEGITNREIGDRLFVSLGTVKRHTHNIYSKLGVSSRTQAIIRGQELGMME